MKMLGQYQNGNYMVTIFEDGTKIRENELDFFEPAFSENCDVKFTHKCSQGCPFCYEGCTKDGQHSDILKQHWIDHMHPFTELAINGNDLDHPDLLSFLEKMFRQKVIVNVTVNQNQFLQNFELLKKLYAQKLVRGIGVSLVKATPELLEKVQQIPNIVIHTINGILSREDVALMENRGLKILILGYKNVRRGESYKASHESEVLKNQKWLFDNLDNVRRRFKVISFDNLAIEQLAVDRLLTREEWDEFYMGDDGEFTFYIDAVAGTFAKNSVLSEKENFPIGNMTIDEMFIFIKNKYRK